MSKNKNLTDISDTSGQHTKKQLTDSNVRKESKLVVSVQNMNLVLAKFLLWLFSIRVRDSSLLKARAEQHFHSEILEKVSSKIMDGSHGSHKHDKIVCLE